MAIKKWAQIDSQGNVTCVVQFETKDTETFTNPQGVTFVIPPDGVDDAVTIIQSYKWKNGAWSNVGPKPSIFHDWDGTAWVYNLARAKADKWNQIKNSRDSAEYGGFLAGTDRYDSDAVSQSRIQGAVIRAMRDSTSTVDWTLADNSVKTLTATQMIAVGDALATHVSAQHEKSRTLRTQIESATTQTQLDAITWA